MIFCHRFVGPMGERLDNMKGGNPNQTAGQVYGGAPGVGGYGDNMGGGGRRRSSSPHDRDHHQGRRDS